MLIGRTQKEFANCNQPNKDQPSKTHVTNQHNRPVTPPFFISNMQYRKLATASRILEHNQSGGKATQKAL
jgi:hypothetical protein